VAPPVARAHTRGMGGRSPLLLVGLVLACAETASAQGMTVPRRQTVSGVVLDSGGVTLAGADVRLLVGRRAIAHWRTEADGRFSLVGDVMSSMTVEVRRLGYHPSEVALRLSADSVQTITVTLLPIVIRLGPIEVLAARESGEGVGMWLHDFDMRRETNSFGRYFTGVTLRSSGVYQTSEILRTIPGVRVSATGRYGNTVRMRGCRQAPLLWVDGTRVSGAELDEVARPGDIAGMEVYTSMAGLPAQFMDRHHSPCGTIVIWTRHR
jgi:hypothetical protein